MTSLYNSAYGSNYYSPTNSSYTTGSCAKTNSSCGATANSAADSYAGDSVDISSEGESAYRQSALVAARSSTYPVLADIEQAPNAFSWAFGNTLALGLRSVNKFQSTSGSEREGALNTRIAEILKVNGIELGQYEKLSFSIDQDGKVAVGEGLSEEKRFAIEQALNRDEDFVNDMIFTQALKRYDQNGYDTLTRAIVEDAHARETAPDEYVKSELPEFEFKFSYMDGAITYPGESDPKRIFNDRIEILGDLSRLVGLEESAADPASFVKSLDALIEEETQSLQSLLNSLMSQVGLGNETKKITFGEDADGNIVVLGNIRADKKKELEKKINGDTDLVERIKDQKAKMEIADEVRKSLSEDEGGPAAIDALLSTENGPAGLGSESLSAARTQLLNSYLKKNAGLTLDSLSMTRDADGEMHVAYRDQNGNETGHAALQELLNDFSGLKHELLAHLEGGATSGVSAAAAEPIAVGEESSSDEPECVRTLLSIKRGALEGASDEEEIDFESWARSIRSALTRAGETEDQDGAVLKYNKQFAKFDSDLEITDFTVRIDDKGRMRVENVQTRGGTEEDNRRAEKIVNSLVSGDVRESAKGFGEALLAHHDDEHGDVQQYKHRIILASGLEDAYRIESPDADRAAMEEFESLSGKIGQSLNSLFQTFNIDEPFDIHWNGSELSINKLFGSTANGKRVMGVLDQLNERLGSADPLDESPFSTKLTPEWSKLLDQFLELGEIRDKFHDPQMREAGLTFTVAGKKTRV